MLARVEIDLAILRWWNTHVQFGVGLERWIGFMAFQDLFKGFVVVAAFAAAWFRPALDQARRHRVLLAGLAAAILATGLNRLLAAQLPFRIRPLRDPASGFVPPPGARPLAFSDLSSFPSDHAVLFVALGAAIARAAPGIGRLTLLYVAVAILLPRLHLGLHWPSDLLAGALLGLAAHALAQTRAGLRLLADPGLRLAARRPGLFHTGLILALLGVGTLFHTFAELGWYLTLR
jgi:membrane-associated phospholipid phosphatase